MPVYTYQGKKYTLDETDPQKAADKIKAFLGEGVKSPITLGKVLTPEFLEDDTFLPSAAKQAAASAAGSMLSIPQTAMTLLKTGSLDRAAETQEATTQFITEKLYKPKTEKAKAGADVGNQLLDYVPENMGKAAELAAKYGLAVPQEVLSSQLQGRPYNKANEDIYYNPAKTIGEFVGEVGVLGGAGAAARGASKPHPKLLQHLKSTSEETPFTPEQQALLRKAQELAKADGRSNITPADIKAAQEAGTRTPTQQTEFDLSPEQLNVNDILAAEKMAAQGELQSMFESQQFLTEELSGTRDMFDPYTDPRLGDARTSARERPEPALPPEAVTHGDVANLDPNQPTVGREVGTPDATLYEKTDVPTDPREAPTYEGALARQEGRLDIPEQHTGADLTRPPLELAPEGPLPSRAAQQGGLEYNPNDLSTTEQTSLGLDTPQQPVKAPSYDTLPEAERQFNLDFTKDGDIEKLLVRANQAEKKPAFSRTALDRLAIAARDEWAKGNDTYKAGPSVARYQNDALGKAVIKGDFRGALEAVADNSSNPVYRLLARTLQRDPDFAPFLRTMDTIVNSDTGKADANIAGLYSRTSNTITMATRIGHHASEKTFLHEAIHAKIVRLQYRLEHDLALPSSVAQGVRNIQSLYEYAKKVGGPDLAQQYGMRDMYEFVTEAFTNPEFQQMLKDLRINKEVHTNMWQVARNGWDAFVHQVAKVLGLDPTRKHIDVLSATLTEGAQLFRAIDTDPVARSIINSKDGVAWNSAREASFTAPDTTHASVDKPAKQSFAEFKDELSRTEDPTMVRTYGKALYEAYEKQWAADNLPRPQPLGYDNRPHAELKEDLFRPDGSRRLDDVWFPPQSPAALAAQRHPIIRRVYDQVSQATVIRDNLFNKWWRGASTEDRGGFNPLKLQFTNLNRAKRVESPTSVGALGRKLSTDEGKAVLEVIAKYGNSSPELLLDPVMMKANGLSAKASQYLKALINTGKDIFDEVNKVRVAKGLEAIPYNPSWIMSRVRLGAYQTWVIDPRSNKHLHLAGFDNAKDAAKHASYLRQQGYDAFSGPANDNPRNNQVVPSDAFLAAANLLVDDPAMATKMRELSAEAIKRMGINRYAMTRDSSAGGYAGSMEIVNSLGPQKAWEGFNSAMESYVRSAANYVGAADANARVGELFVDKEVNASYPNALRSGRYMWEQFTGKEHYLDSVLKKVALQMNQSPYLFGNLLSGSANAFISVMLVWQNSGFWLANALQWVFMPPRLAEINSTQLGGKGSVSLALLQGAMDMYLPTKESKAIFQKALEGGSLEARFAEALDWATTFKGAVPKTVKYMMGEKVAAYADTYSRGLAYAISYRFAKSAGMDDKVAHSFAARESQAVMLQYEKWARMPVLNALGPVGNAVAPLTSFVSNMFVRVADYAKDATLGDKASGKRTLTPIMATLGMLVAVAGVRGLPGYEDLEKAWLALNAYLVENFGIEPLPLPQEYMADVPAALEYGIPSALTGVNLSGTLGMGTVLGNIGSTAGLDYYTNAATGLYKSTENVFTEKDSAHAQYSRLAAVSPTGLREIIRSVVDERDPRTPANIKDSRGSLVYRRDKGEQTAALLTGRAPLGEVEAKRAKNTLATLERAANEAQKSATSRLAESMMKGQPTPKFVTNVLKNYPEKIDAIFDGAIARIEESGLTSQEKKMLKDSTMQEKMLAMRAYKNADKYQRNRTN